MTGADMTEYAEKALRSILRLIVNCKKMEDSQVKPDVSACNLSNWEREFLRTVKITPSRVNEMRVNK